MNTPASNRRRQTKPANAAKLSAAASSSIGHQFEEMPDPLTIVDHLTIPGFIRRAPHRFHMDEITRFGDKVGRVAESFKLSYRTTIDRQLGEVRIFPVPLMERVYAVMAAQFGWEPLATVVAPEDGAAATLRANARASKRLEEAAGTVTDTELAQAIATVRHFLQSDSERLQGEDASPAPAMPPSSPRPM